MIVRLNRGSARRGRPLLAQGREALALVKAKSGNIDERLYVGASTPAAVMTAPP